MGEEAKQKEAKAEGKPEEKAEEKKEDKAEEEKKEEPKPPSPCILFVDLHCVGCAKKIEKCILKIRGVEGVVIDMLQNQVTIKGVVEPQAVCAKIMKRTKRRVQVLSPLPAAEGEPIPEIVNSQVSGLETVELNINMHCEACAGQLKKKILKMRGVRTVTTELSSGKVTVTGTMDPNMLVDYVYRHTKKQAKIVPQPELKPEPIPEEKKEEKPESDSKAEEKRDEESAEKRDEESAEKKEGGEKEGKKEGENKSKEEKGGENKDEGKKEGEEEQNIITDEQAMQRMVYYYQPLYVMERIPPPQLFSDENPNACCIT